MKETDSLGVGMGQQEPYLIIAPLRPVIWWVVHEYGRDYRRWEGVGGGKEKQEEGMKEEGREGGNLGPREEKLRPHLSLQVCSQPHLRCAQLQGPAGQVGLRPTWEG